MTDAGFFRGTSSEQDNRFSDKEKKLMKQMKFAECLTKKIDMTKIQLEAIKPWITGRILELLGMEDDVLNEFVFNQLEADNSPDGRRIQINLTGFLNGKNARIFMSELWDLLISAQENESGIPTSLLDAKKDEIKKRNEELKEKEKNMISETLKRTIGRFTDKLQTREYYRNSKSRSKSRDRDNKKPKSDDETKPSSPPSMKQDSKNESRRQYKSRKSSSSSPDIRRKSKSRSRSRSRERERRDRDKGGGGGRKDLLLESKDGKSFRDSYWRDRERREGGRDRFKEDFRRGGGRGGGGGDRDRRRFSSRSRSKSPLQLRPRRRSRSPPPRRSRSKSPMFRGGRRQDMMRGSPPRKMYRPRSFSKSPPPRDRRLENLRPGEYDSNRKEISIESENGNNENKKSSASEDDSASDDSTSQRKKKEKKKKDKKHKKHKKHKKGKKSKKDDDDDDEDDDEEIDDDKVPAPAFGARLFKLETTSPSEDLERKLREKALESMKKAVVVTRK